MTNAGILPFEKGDVNKTEKLEDSKSVNKVANAQVVFYIVLENCFLSKYLSRCPLLAQSR